MNEDLPLKTFIIYAREDKEYKNQLLSHLNPLVDIDYLQIWHDGDIMLGDEWEKQIKLNLENSELVLVLVSINSLGSKFIKGTELATAVERHHEGKTRIVPIIVSPCLWDVNKIFRDLQGLPAGLIPVSDWPNPHSAWNNIAVSLKTMVDEIRAKRARELKTQRNLEEQQRRVALEAERARQQNEEQAERNRLEQAQRAEKERLQQKNHTEWTHQANNTASQTKGANQSNYLIFGGLGVLLVIFIGIWIIRSNRDPNSMVKETPLKKNGSVKKEMDAWSQAEKTDTYTAYQNYLTDYKDGAHAPIARIRLSNFKDSTKVYLQDAERLIRNQKRQNAEPMLRKILEKFDPDNVRAKSLLLR